MRITRHEGVVSENTPQPVWYLDAAVGYLRERLVATRRDGTNFDRVFIERPGEMLVAEGTKVMALKLYRP